MGDRKDIFDELLRSWQTTLPKLRNQHGRYNCPMTAEAVFNYLSSGRIVEARAVVPPDSTGECDDSVPVTVTSLRQMLKKAGHGTHGVVTATNGEKEHSANVLNIRGQIYLADAYNATPVFTQALEGNLKWAAKLEFSWGWKMYIIPKGQTLTCPEPAPVPRKFVRGKGTANGHR